MIYLFGAILTSKLNTVQGIKMAKKSFNVIKILTIITLITSVLCTSVFGLWNYLWYSKTKPAVQICIQKELHPIRNKVLKNEKGSSELKREINEIKRMQVWVVTKLGGDPMRIIK